MKHHIEILRSALLSLKPTGERGFEELMRIALNTITDIDFRLASSGRQFGMDGASASSADLVYFEAKRYDSPPSRETVITKIADLGRVENIGDKLWALCASCEIAAQLASDLETDGQKQGIATLIIDWLPEELPKLAVLVSAIGSTKLADWIVDHSQSIVDRNTLETAVENIRKHSRYAQTLAHIKTDLSSSYISTRSAQRNNKSWLKSSLSNADAARVNFGQPLNLLESGKFVLKREELFSELTNVLNSQNSVAILGEEGSGKSWLAAELMSQHEGITLFLSAEQFVNISPSKVEELIIDSLIIQSGDRITDVTKKRWQTRVDAWVETPPYNPTIVIIDGLNQRPDLEWDRLIVALDFWLSARSGKSIITSRPKYYSKKVKSGIGNRKAVSVADWTAAERGEILGKHSIDESWLDETALNSLLNPRLLDVALSTLPKSDEGAWKGLNTERLLFEHIRLSQFGRFEPETANEISTKLSNHASKIIEQFQNKPEKPKLYLEEDTKSVSETRFFRSLPGPKNQYELIDNGLNLALGFAVVDRLWSAKNANADIDEYLSKLIEPISALDRTASVLLAALTVCALDDSRFEPMIFQCIVNAFSDLQNLPENFFEAFLQTLVQHPDLTLDIVTASSLEFAKPTNYDWLILVVFRMNEDKEYLSLIAGKVSNWLAHICINPKNQIRKYPSDDAEKYDSDVRKRQKEIEQKIASFSKKEKELFSELIETDGDCETLYCLAFKLLANKPLATHVDDFIKFKFGLSLNHSIYQARKEFTSLTQFNRLDWAETAEGLSEKISWLRDSDISIVGKWALVGILYAIGTEACSEEAHKLALKLKPDRQDFKGWRLVETYCATDPCDPNSVKPDNVDATAEKYRAINPDKILSGFGIGTEGMFLDMALPGIVRFVPDVGLAKHLEILDQLKTRTGFSLRQLVICGTDMMPLVTKEIAAAVMKRFESPDTFTDIEAHDVKATRMFLLQIAFRYLTAEKQLSFAASGSSSDYLLDIAGMMKRPGDTKLIDQLSKARKDKNDDAIFLTLALITNTSGPISDDLASELAKHFKSKSSIIRASVFQIICSENVSNLILQHTKSNWSYKTAETAKSYEAVYGSYALIIAMFQGIITIDDAIQRISPSCWYYAVAMLDSDMTDVIVKYLDQHINRAAHKISDINLPPIEIELSQHGNRLESYISVNQIDENNDGNFADTSSKFHEAQERLKALYKQLDNELSTEGIRFLIDHVDLEFFKSISISHHDILQNWAKQFLELNEIEMRWFKNLALAVSHVLSETDEHLSASLFGKIENVDALVTISYGDDLTLEHQSIWACKSTPAIRALWEKRILSCPNDAVLALEVLAAERFGASVFICDIVDEWCQDERPLLKRYAFTIAGFSSQSEHFENHLNIEDVTHSYFGDSVGKAKYAYERSIWSKHWLQKMLKANSPQEFWIAMKLLCKIIDARTQINNSVISTREFESLKPIVERERRKRLKKWFQNREKTLLGVEKPDPIYLT